jgi:sigma-B regulation protein RsbU (phosphoserine phosphatase)
VAFVESRGIWYVAAPIHLEDGQAGYVAVGEFREQAPSAEAWELPPGAHGLDLTALRKAWETLPRLDRSGHAHAVIAARWAARQMSEWSRRESRLMSATEEVALVGDIAELLTGQQALQTILDRIVSETARVMRCPHCSLRLYDAATEELTIRAVHNLSRDYIDKGVVLRTACAVTDEALRGNVVYVEDVARDTRLQYPDEVRRAGIVSMLTAGLNYRGGPVGVIRVYTDELRRFRKAQRDLLRAVACQAATAIVHARLLEERLKLAETQRQARLAGDLQARMIRIPPPRHPCIETALAFHPTYEVAGDFCDFLPLPGGGLGAVVADVVGKGIPASLLMSSVRGALRALAETIASPAELLRRLNRQLCRETRPGEFVTLHLVTIDAAGRQLTYANAGHEPLLLLRGGELQETPEGNLVLGINPREEFEEHTLALRPGDLLLLYTDGAVEARNFADEQYGRERLHASVHTHGALPPQQVLTNMVWDIRRFVGLAEQADDLTLVALRIR